MSTRFTRVLFGAVLFAAAVAQAKVVYVAPDSKRTKDGTSWETAYSSVHDAYTNAADGATAEVPGEVWIKKGLYLRADRGQGFPDRVLLQPHVRVYGGFAGGETSVDEADPETNWSIISASGYVGNATKYYWVDEKGVSQGGIWTNVNGVYTYNPIPEGVYWRGCDCGNVPCFVDKTDTVVGSGEDNEFHGLVLTACSKGGAFQLTTGVSSVKIRNCKFLGNTGYQNNGNGTIHTSGRVSLLVEGCRFEGCNTAMNFGSTTADTVITVTNCQFVSNYAKSSTAAGITFGTGEGLLNVLGCAFERGWLASNQLALDLSLAGKRTVVRNCTFSDGWCLGDYNAASILVLANGITVDIERCTFTGIRSRITGNSYASAACIKDQASLSSSSVIVRDTAFIGNVMETTGTPDNAYRCFGSVYGGQSGSEHQFVNCLFASNVLYHGATKMGYPGTIQGGYDGGNFLVVNCLFKDNDVFRIVTAEDGTATTNRLPEIEIGRVDTRPRRVMNTIMMNSAADYKPFNSNPPGLKSMCIPGYTGFPAGDKTLLTCDPLLLDGPTERNGVTAWGLKCGSPCRKAGFVCWAGTNRRFYRYDPAGNAEKPWVSLLQGERLTDVEAADVGVSLAAAPLPDAFGEARNPNRVALGQLNAPVAGLMLLVR